MRKRNNQGTRRSNIIYLIRIFLKGWKVAGNQDINYKIDFLRGGMIVIVIFILMMWIWFNILAIGG